MDGFFEEWLEHCMDRILALPGPEVFDLIPEWRTLRPPIKNGERLVELVRRLLTLQLAGQVEDTRGQSGVQVG